MTDWDNEYEEDWSDDDDGDTLVIPCSACGADVYEDAEWCPICGEYIVHRTDAWQQKPTWWVVLGLAGIIATVIVLSGF